MKKFLFIFIIALLMMQPFLVLSQDINCKISNKSFQAGETVTYNAVYNWGIIWLNAGDVVFTVKDTLFSNRPAYHIKSVGRSLKGYDWFYKVRDRFESIIEKDSFNVLWFERDTYEGGFKTYNRYNFDNINKTVDISSYTSKRSFKKEILELKSCTFDVLSAIYYCRNIDFKSLVAGQRVPLPMVVDNEIFNLYVRYIGKETLTLHDGRKFETIKFTAMLVEGTIFKGGEDLIVWVTDDANRIPVLIEAKILIGSVKAELSTVSGLRN